MNIKEIRAQIRNQLQPYSPTPELDTDVIIEHIVGLNRINLIINQDYILSSLELLNLDIAVQKRINKIPIAYILGYKEFYGRRFGVNENVLIPRPETEAIIDITKDQLTNISKPIIWEVGTGSGCIAITLARELPKAIVYASDISNQALLIAKNNDIIIGGSRNNIKWLEGNLLSPFTKAIPKPDIIIANLPYLDIHRYKDDSILSEPNLALYSKKEGLDHYIRLLREINKTFIAWPRILIELNPEQVKYFKSYCEELTQIKYTVFKDLQGLDRHILLETQK